MNQALLLIDLQNDFCPGGALAVPEGDQVIETANLAMAKAKSAGIAVVASLDWHPSNHGSFAVNAGGKVGELGELDGLPQVWWPAHCIENSAGAQLHPDLNAEFIDKQIYKGRQARVDSYSAFFDNDHRGQTELDSWLKQREITLLTVMGLATDYCVKYTVLDALSLGYIVQIVAAGCRGVNLAARDSERAIEQMLEQGARLIEPKEFALPLSR